MSTQDLSEIHEAIFKTVSDHDDDKDKMTALIVRSLIEATEAFVSIAAVIHRLPPDHGGVDVLGNEFTETCINAYTELLKGLKQIDANRN